MFSFQWIKWSQTEKKRRKDIHSLQPMSIIVVVVLLFIIIIIINVVTNIILLSIIIVFTIINKTNVTKVPLMWITKLKFDNERRK